MENHSFNACIVCDLIPVILNVLNRVVLFLYDHCFK